MRRDRSPAPSAIARDASSAPRAARCSSTRLARLAPISRPSCCACSRMARCCASAARSRARSTCASSQRPTASCATEVAAGRFRADLYFRLNVIPLRIAPLRERREDILPLAHHFLAFHSTEAGRPLMLSPEAADALLAYPWPGNVRELENVIERAVVMSGQETLMPEAFAFDEDAADEDLVHVAGASNTATEDSASNSNHAQNSAPAPEAQDEGTLQAALDRAATVRIRAALATAGGNRVDAATALGVDRTTLYRLMKRLSL